MVRVVEEWDLRQGRRRDRHFRELLASGALDDGALRALRGDPDVAATAEWVALQSARLLVVPHEGVRVFPAFQFDRHGELRSELADPVAPLQRAGLRPWQTRSWLVSPTGRLSGGVPSNMVRSDPVRAARAVQRLIDDLVG